MYEIECEERELVVPRGCQRSAQAMKVRGAVQSVGLGGAQRRGDQRLGQGAWATVQKKRDIVAHDPRRVRLATCIARKLRQGRSQGEQQLLLDPLRLELVRGDPGAQVACCLVLQP